MEFLCELIPIATNFTLLPVQGLYVCLGSVHGSAMQPQNCSEEHVPGAFACVWSSGALGRVLEAHCAGGQRSASAVQL